MSWDFSEHSFNVMSLAGIFSSRTESPFSKVLPHLCPSVCLRWLLAACLGSGHSATIPTVPYNSIYMRINFHFQQYHFLFLCCTLILLGHAPFHLLISENVTQISHWEMRRQHDYTLCSLWASCRTHVQPPPVGWSFTKHVIGGRALKFVLYALAHS